MLSKTLGIELGSTFTKIYIKNKEIFFNEATAISFKKYDNSIIAIGNKARKLYNKEPEDIKTILPIEEGSIKNLKATLKFLDTLINKALGKLNFLRPEIVISLPVELSTVELRAYDELFDKLKVKRVYSIKEPILAAIGAKINLNEPRAVLIVNFGGGKTDIGVISLGGLIYGKLVKIGGEILALSIKNYIENFYEIDIDTKTSEYLRDKVLKVLIPKKQENKICKITGKDKISNSARTIEVKSSELRDVVMPYIKEIVKGIKLAIQNSPSEAMGDFLQDSFFLTGGMANLLNFNEYLYEELGIKPHIPENPQLCTINGLKFVVNNLEFYKESLRLK